MVRASEQKRDNVKARREEWQEQQKTMEREHLVFLDESGVNLNMTRRYGRAVGKNRIYDYVPLKTPKNTTLLSSIRLENASMVHKELTGAVNGETFLEYIRNALAPTESMKQLHRKGSAFNRLITPTLKVAGSNPVGRTKNHLKQ